MGKHLQKATFRQRVAIYELLKEHLEVRDDNTCCYKGNMNDEAIAKLVEGSTKRHVAGVRASEFGNLYRVPARSNDLVNRVEQLETVVANLVKLLEDTTNKHDTLCKALSLNKVVDVRHLAIKQPAVSSNGPVPHTLHAR